MVLIKVCLTSDLPPGKMVKFDVLGHTTLLANVNGTYYAMDGMCSHAMGDLSRGKLDGFVIECPRHQWRFDIRSGKLVGGPSEPLPANKDLRAYPVSVHDDCVYVDMF
ncbi:MAG: Rieske (2Fe-2S) protein [Candidatus Saccharibacteria bacterium]